MSFSSISLTANIKYLNPLVADYLFLPEKIKNLFNHFADKNGFENIIKEISNHTFDRKQLVDILLHQTQTIENTSKETLQNIEKLSQSNTFTITTGHQLNLLTGPLFFIYKISATIYLSQHLSQLFPEYNFVPIYWMASEDHDAEEINHFYFKDQKFQWNISSDGTPVGSIPTDGLNVLFNQMKESNLFPDEVIQLFENTYLKHSSLADATRYLVNHLFSDKGIVILDPTTSELKNKFKHIFYDDIFENKIYHLTQNNVTFLKENHYHIQANPQKINTFYIHQNKRYLIKQEENNFKLKGTGKILSENELKNLLEEHPERFSPNVLLRPLFQQTILPNIAYIGGSAEISYWLLLKQTFQSYSIPYPILLQRPILFLSPKNIERKINKLNVLLEDIFNNDIHQLAYKILEKNNLSVRFDEQKQQVEKIFNAFIQQAQSIDPTLISTINAELTKTLKSIENIEQKMNKAIKQKNEIIQQQLSDIYNNFFPQNTMQDRIWNIAFAYQITESSSLKNFIDNIFEHCDIDIYSHKNFQLKILKP
ncbi:MAG: bacillithiol biosynthesis cysteine-adding enzyme BshC [Bacteroidia bacterium]